MSGIDLSKFASRKFVISSAAFLASLGGGLMGYFTGNDAVTTVGIVCMCLSAALYAAAEAYVDGKAAASTTTSTTISASTTAKDVVTSALNTGKEAQ